MTTWLKARGALELAHSMKLKQDVSWTPVGLQRNNTSVWKVKTNNNMEEGPTDLPFWGRTHCCICSKDGRQDALVLGCSVIWNLIGSSRSWGGPVHCFWSTSAGFTSFIGTRFTHSRMICSKNHYTDSERDQEIPMKSTHSWGHLRH